MNENGENVSSPNLQLFPFLFTGDGYLNKWLLYYCSCLRFNEIYDRQSTFIKSVMRDQLYEKKNIIPVVDYRKPLVCGFCFFHLIYYHQQFFRWQLVKPAWHGFFARHYRPYQ
jgi:hypothetical protein